MSGLIGTKEGIVKILLALLISVGVCAALLVGACLILLMTDDPGASAHAVSLSVLIVSAFVCGIISVRMTGSVFSGIITGCALTVILFIVSVIFFKRETDGLLSLFLHAAVILCSFAGSLIGRKKNGRSARLRRIKRRR